MCQQPGSWHETNIYKSVYIINYALMVTSVPTGHLYYNWR